MKSIFLAAAMGAVLLFAADPAEAGRRHGYGGHRHHGHGGHYHRGGYRGVGLSIGIGSYRPYRSYGYSNYGYSNYGYSPYGGYGGGFGGYGYGGGYGGGYCY